jgi:hypothetical protein
MQMYEENYSKHSGPAASPQWSALHTRYQHERTVETLLVAKGFETFLPTYERVRRWKDRNKRIAEALFPGYLFVANVHQPAQSDSSQHHLQSSQRGLHHG